MANLVAFPQLHSFLFFSLLYLLFLLFFIAKRSFSAITLLPFLFPFISPVPFCPWTNQTIPVCGQSQFVDRFIS